jgi:hypothetical protein
MTSLEQARRLIAKKSTVTCNVMNPGLIPTTGAKSCPVPPSMLRPLVIVNIHAMFAFSPYLLRFHAVTLN